MRYLGDVLKMEYASCTRLTINMVMTKGLVFVPAFKSFQRVYIDNVDHGSKAISRGSSTRFGDDVIPYY